MEQDKKENLKIGLLGLIAVTLLLNTWMLSGKKSSGAAAGKEVESQSSAVANPGSNNTPNMPGQLNPVPGNNNNPANPVTNPATPPSNQKSTKVAFRTYQHDFGHIKQNSTNKFAFQFTNTGDEPLIITNAVGSCGCTVPNYPKTPIAPGATGTIDVEYKPGTQKDNQERK